MSNKDEALKLALEALEYIDRQDNDRDFLSPEECCDLDDAITAIREALAEQPAQQQEPVYVRDEATGYMYTVLSQFEQEQPVAKVCHDLDGHIGWNPKLTELPDEGALLYTSPPASKPLTEEEISRLNLSAVTVKDAILDVREVERAHGIKGDV